jgi:hypothetical protein
MISSLTLLFKGPPGYGTQPTSRQHRLLIAASLVFLA